MFIIVIIDPTLNLLPSANTHHLTSVSTMADSSMCKINGRKQVCNVDMSCQRQLTKKWSADVDKLLSSEQWLKIYGLKHARLDVYSLLRQIGFRHSDGKGSCVLICCFAFKKLCFDFYLKNLYLKNLQFS